MNLDNLEQKIIDAILLFQTLSGYPFKEVTRNTIPYMDIKGFDEYAASNLIAEISKPFGVKIFTQYPDDNFSAFSSHGCLITIAEAAKKFQLELISAITQEKLNNETEWKNLCRQIRALRDAKRLSREMIAASIGLSLSTYKKIEECKRKPSQAELLALATIFDVDYFYLISA